MPGSSAAMPCSAGSRTIFPSLSGGEYIFDNIKLNPFTFEPMLGGMETHSVACLRSWHAALLHSEFRKLQSLIPTPTNMPGFVQDTVRVTSRLALNLGLRYDLQTFSTAGLVTNPLWPGSGKVPFNDSNFAPRVGFAYSIGNDRPLVIRAGYGWFYTRIPQIYTSTVASDNGAQRQLFFSTTPTITITRSFRNIPTPLVDCPVARPRRARPCESHQLS